MVLDFPNRCNGHLPSPVGLGLTVKHLIMSISRSFWAAVVALLGFASLVFASPFAHSSPLLTRQSDSVPVPADDPFYTPPAGFENTEPGTVLRSRPFQSTLFSKLSYSVCAYQILYRTTAVDGCPIATVTTVFKPESSNVMTDRFVSYATAYDSSDSKCDPSYAYRLGTSNSSDVGDSDLEFLLISAYMNLGYIVNSPDYEGPGAAFGPGHLAGMCVLDSMRAVINFRETIGFTTDRPGIFGQGYSGGAIATGWAASLQPTYAPELPIKGWAHGGTPANLTGVTVYIDGTDNSGYLVAAVSGLAMPTAYGAELQPVLNRILTPSGKAAVAYGDTHCSSDDLSTYSNVSITSYDFQKLGPAIFEQPTIKRVFKANIMGRLKRETPAHPVLVYHSIQDQIIPWHNASSLVDRWCSRGANVTFTTYESGTHEQTAVNAIGEVFAFADSVFAGTTPVGCVRNLNAA